MNTGHGDCHIPGMAVEAGNRTAPRWGAAGQAILALAVLVLAPLSGLALVKGGAAVGAHLTFPPRPPQPAEGGFSWPLFLLGLAAETAVLVPIVRLATRTRRAAPPTAAPFPAWGVGGIILTVGAWLLAWGALPDALDPLRWHSFTPLWLGYVLTIQAWTRRRTGTCLLSRAPMRILALFPASAGFWWLFEYLNGFVGNWLYLGTRDLPPLAYALQASLPFMTVLPAVISTRDLLASFPRVHEGLRATRAAPHVSPVFVLAAAALALGLLPALPGWLFPLLWLAPASVVIAVQALAGSAHLFTLTRAGDWRAPWLAALSGLVCGFLWEMWNWGSLTRWSYQIPHVDGAHVFAMPLLGYGGYLPFGITCVAVASMLCGIASADRGTVPEGRAGNPP